MATGETDVSICADALVLLGATAISSFADGTEAAGICERLYPGIRDMTLSMYPWSFTLGKAQLQRLSGSPTNEWRYWYAMPSDTLTGLPRAVYISAAFNDPLNYDWEIYEGRLLTNETTVFVDYQRRPSVAEMPGYFTQLLRYMLAWHLAEPITDQTEKGAYWRGIATGGEGQNDRGGFFRQAASIDGQGQPPRTFEDFTLIGVR